jgi:hypothetical protein
VKLQLSALIGTASNPVMQKIRIIGSFFENRLQWQFEVGKRVSTNDCIRLHIYLRTNKILIRNSLYVFDSWGEIQAIKRSTTVTVIKCFTRRAKPIRMTSVLIGGVLLYVLCSD